MGEWFPKIGTNERDIRGSFQQTGVSLTECSDTVREEENEGV